MHLSDSAVHQQLFLDVLNGTKVLVGVASYQFSFPNCLSSLHYFCRCFVIIGVFRWAETEFLSMN